MNRNKKITLTAIMAALSATFMLLSFFPYLTYAIPAIAGLFIMVLVIEIDCKWALAAYIVSSALVFLFAEPESKLLFICFFGYYPILKAIIEKIGKRTIEWILKFLAFNVAVLVAYFVFAALLGVSVDDIGQLGKYGAIILLLLGNVVFLFYDIAVSRMAMWYYGILHLKINKLFK